VCELLAVGFAAPTPFEELVGYAQALERLGVAGFGWGVAWLEPTGVAVSRGTGRFADEAVSDPALRARSSRRFLVHLRRPNKLSTVSMADTQPFAWDGRHAFCHNGYLKRADELRDRYRGRLRGRADSEVGSLFFRDRLAEGAPPEVALREVDETFGGNVNLGYLGAQGMLTVYSHHEANRLWRFRQGAAELAATGLHSDDDSLFDLVFPEAVERRVVQPGSSATVADPLRSAA
jgi:glutamine phosphoribosylpyrophosphate amidotransferase